MWMTILNYFYPVTDSYSHRPEHLTATGGFTDITSVMWLEPHGYTDEDTCRPFLITQTKASAYQNRDSEWREGARQLGEYLHALSGTKVKRKWFWGILAIGTEVEFYVCNRYDDKLNCYTERLDVERDAQAVRRFLNEIKSKTK
ncbi:hypothetical protein BO78DRAFT_421002 [Aspergillus sclerotiicarbonarius CBS 121057]|uniref:Fungal-type protein kinase domain-containing protein n=1 Tax=Aspergillus sclerotiicarbonarius (strain CBS 121057 / IBT 28362) TaxID=1448318 RepID=A0A319E226_ASPSB|nr:hypothetical protein BO78DRAFT_421002 [Aspergillus sclerotiicarbonarius CBS 121057]